MSTSPDATVRALELLRGLPNPFEALVRPQRPDDRFADLHVPALLREPRDLLLRIIDAYRLAEYRRATDLPDARAVTILGARGSGKTHMIEALRRRTDGQGQLLLCPSYYEPKLSFEEFVLGQLVKALLSGDRPLEAIARQLTRRLVQQAVRSLGPTDRIFAAEANFWRLLWGGAEAIDERFDACADELETAGAGKELSEVASRHGLEPALIFRLVEAHLERQENNSEPLPIVRRELYRAMARSSLLGDGDALGQFVEAEYPWPNARTMYRAEVVQHQLHVLIEACALVRLPIVIAFDNMEGLIAPRGQLDHATAAAFLDGLAQAVDAMRGVLFLVFFEGELYRQVIAHTNLFALDRIRLGVPVPGQGPVDLIELKPPGLEEFDLLIAERLGRLLRSSGNVEQLPAGFPFSAEFLNGLAEKRDMRLRAKLLVLREEYSRLVYGRGPVEAAPDAPRPTGMPVLERAWAEQLSAAGRKLEGQLAGSVQALHAGLRRLLENAGPARTDGWQLVAAESATVGDHVSYGMVTMAAWRKEANSADGNGAEPLEHRVGVGFLLAKGPGMPKDLQAKFELFHDMSLRANGLVVLWPREGVEDDPVAALPEATRQAWQLGQRRRQAALRVIRTEDLRQLLAFPDWLDAITAGETPIRPAEIQAFVQKRCQNLVHLARPPVADERTVPIAN